MTELRHVYLPYINISLRVLIRLMLLEKVNYIHISKLSDDNMRVTPAESRSPVESLIFCSLPQPLSEQVFCEVLRLAQVLTYFTCSVPSTPAPGYDLNDDRRRPIPMSGIVSPQRILLGLSPLKNTLTQLILGHPTMYWSLHNGSRLDLSDFHVLWYICVPSYMFFADNAPWTARLGTLGLLPSSLVSMRVRWLVFIEIH